MGVWFGVLGPLEIRRDGKAVSTRRAKDRSLLFALLLRPNAAVSTDALIDALWGENPPHSAVESVQASVSNLRRVLGPDVLETRRPGYVLRVAPEDLDALAFESLVVEGRSALAGGEARAASEGLTRALALWRGPALLEVAGEPFATAEAQRLEELRLVATEIHAEAELALGRHSIVLPRLNTLTAEHPLREHLRSLHMLGLYRAGRQAEALRSYQEHRETLVEELGVEPAPEVQRLERRILAQDPTLALEEGDPVETPQHRHNLPAATNELVGRELELEAVKKLLQTDRLVSLVGAGGAGKTALALEVARSLLTDFDGVWFVELADLGDGALVPAAVVSALGLRERPGASLAQMVAAVSANRSVLIVLDNCEHLAAAVSELCVELLAASERVRILTTTRERLLVRGESAFSVPPLAVPPDTENFTPEDARVWSAVRLLVDRIEQADPSFSLSAGAAIAAAQICQRVDGLPLAIELAAARARMIPLEELAPTLEDRLGTLVVNGSPGGRRGRQDSLFALIDWSHTLLGTTEQALLRRLAAFAGGADMKAIAAVATGDPVVEAEVARTIWSLVDKSLVLASAPSGRARYSMLDTIREYATTRLREAGEDGAVAVRHLEWVENVVTREMERIPGADDVEALDALDREHDNIRTAVARAFDGDDRARTRTAIAITMRLAPFWTSRGHLRDGVTWCERALQSQPASRPESRSDERTRGELLARLASFLLQLSDFAAARARLEEAASIAERLDDDRLRCDVHYHRASLSTFVGEYSPGRTEAETALTIAERLGDEARQASCRLVLGTLARFLGDRAAAAEHLESSASLFRARHDRRQLGAALANLGAERIRRGDHEGAVELLEEATVLLRAIGATQVLAATLGTLANALLNLGRLDEAEARYEESAAIASATGEQVMLTSTANLASLRELKGDLDGALASYREVLDAGRDLGAHSLQHSALAGIGSVLCRRGDLGAALAAEAEALAIRVEIGYLRGILDSLDAIGVIRGRMGHIETAGFLIGASDRLRAAEAVPREPSSAERIAGDVQALQIGDGAAFAAGMTRAASANLDEAVAAARDAAENGVTALA